MAQKVCISPHAISSAWNCLAQLPGARFHSGQENQDIPDHRAYSCFPGSIPAHTWQGSHRKQQQLKQLGREQQVTRQASLCCKHI